MVMMMMMIYRSSIKNHRIITYRIIARRYYASLPRYADPWTTNRALMWGTSLHNTARFYVD